MNNGTSTKAGAFGPVLTVDVLLEAWRDLEALLPELLYRTHEHVPRTKDGEPFFAQIPEFDWQIGDVTGKHIVYMHPDNLSLFRLKVKGMFRIVEWQQENNDTTTTT